MNDRTKKAIAVRKEKADNNPNNIAVVAEVLKLVSVDDIKRAYNNKYLNINYSAIAKHLQAKGLLTSKGSTNWTPSQAKRAIERILERTHTDNVGQ